MNETRVPGSSEDDAPAPPLFYPWRDAYGREHPTIPRCVGGTRPRGGWSKGRTWRDCQRKGVVQRGLYGGRQAWFCLQHDPARRDERRVAELAPHLLDLLEAAVELMPRTRRTTAWMRQADAALATARGSPDHSSTVNGAAVCRK